LMALPCYVGWLIGCAHRPGEPAPRGSDRPGHDRSGLPVCGVQEAARGVLARGGVCHQHPPICTSPARPPVRFLWRCWLAWLARTMVADGPYRPLIGMQVEQMRGHLTSCGIDDKLQIVRGCAQRWRLCDDDADDDDCDDDDCDDDDDDDVFASARVCGDGGGGGGGGAGEPCRVGSVPG
jgi:hypothetical protein